MKPTVPTTLLFSVLLSSLVHADTPTHSAINPQSRGGDWWANRAEQLNQRVKEVQDSKLIFIGDSITQGWEGAGAKVWKERYDPKKAINLGIGGDRTQHVLYRLHNGNLDGIQPKVAVVMIGTNNSNGTDNTADQIVEGVSAIVDSLRAKVPETKILLLGIFPRGENINPQRGKILQINQVLAKRDDGEHIHFLDIGHRFVTKEGLIPQKLMPDFLHLSEEGYGVWADAIEPKLKQLLGEDNEADAASPLAGSWKFVIGGPNDEDVEFPMDLVVKDGSLTGRIGRGEEDKWLEVADGKVDGDSFSFTVKRDRSSGAVMTYSIKGALEKDTLVGEVSTEFNGESVTREWKALRREESSN